MNLYGHYYFAKRPFDSPLYTLGLIFSDLDRKNRYKHYGNDAVKEGIKEHHKAARKLHTQEWFVNAQHDLTASHEGPRFKFNNTLYHCGMELALDYLLMPTKPGLVAVINTKLSNRDVRKFLKKKNKKVLGAIDYLLRDYIFESYGSKKGCIRGLGRTYYLIIKKYPEITPDEAPNLAMIFERALEVVKPRVDSILELFSNHRQEEP